ncbi:hypothetical protein DOTSEDRAFT_69257 [Dothistroma septosporum NZE10]|uniref:SMODS and SLOG-associating 2TM effector domain-containing protein n=1 Tax=Dothistroma septosporum (strain NZE10 / CBS 128990) TaxID=675120 RepID=N1PUT3_DOTSN|nr:hypothetical protein DOTSEDRAFT_69257 [Dothistroma septosporum NZE10]
MHELPKDLAKSLRSWRGSLYRKPSDIEKGGEDYGEKQYDLSPAQSSLGLHSASSRSLRQARYTRLQEHAPPNSRPSTQQHTANEQQGSQLQAKRQVTLPPQTPASGKQSFFHNAPKVSDLDPAANRLDDNETPLQKNDFYELVGMYKPKGDIQPPKELAIPHGLYWKIRTHMRYIQTKYRIFDVATYVFLALQLLLSAVFIVLGSVAGNYHVAIAVLGAISTVIAGLLALMKGQGLPNRLRQIRDDLQLVLFEAEELYWDVAADRPVMYKDIKKLREDFLRVQAAARRNHPDSWTSNANHIAQGIRGQSKTKANPATTAALPV